MNDAFDKELEAGRDTRDTKKRLEHYPKAEEIMQTDVGYVPVAWVARTVVDGNIYVDMMTRIYVVEKT